MSNHTVDCDHCGEDLRVMHPLTAKRHQESQCVKGLCKICKNVLSDDENSLHYDCGGDCLWCMAKAGDPECQARVQGFMMDDCMAQMRAAVDEFESELLQVGMSTGDFRMRILEQWRPW